MAFRSPNTVQEISSTIVPAAFTTDSTTVDGAGVDLRDALWVQILCQVGASSAGTTLMKIQESDDNSTFTDCTSATTGAVSTASRTYSVVAKRGSSLTKRYARLRIINAGFTGVRGGLLTFGPTKGAGRTPTHEASVVVEVVA
jgi:hypothetical protein